MRKEQVAFRGALAPVDRAGIIVARIAHGSDAERQLLQPGVIVADVHVAIPHAWHQRLAFAVDDWAPAGGFTSAAGPSAAITPLSTTTVWSERKCRLSASNNLTLVKATGVVGTLANDLANAGIRAASASPCAFCSFSRSLSYPSGNHEIPR